MKYNKTKVKAILETEIIEKNLGTFRRCFRKFEHIGKEYSLFLND